MTKIETIRALKVMQTQTIVQGEALYGIRKKTDRDGLPEGLPGEELEMQLEDAEVTARNHISALQHCIDRLSEQS